MDHLLKTKKELKNKKKQEMQTIFTKMNLIRLVFNMANGDFKDLARRTASVKVLRDKEFNIAKNRKSDGYQRELASMLYKFFDKTSAGSSVNMHANNESLLNLAEELHKPSIRKFKKGTVYSRYKDIIWGAVDMQLIASLIRVLDFYCALLIFLISMFGFFL